MLNYLNIYNIFKFINILYSKFIYIATRKDFFYKKIN